MKLLITADLHLSLYKNSRLLNELPIPLYYTQINLEKMAKVYKEQECDYFIIAGDLFHDKSHVYMNSYNIIKDFINANSNINFIIITGNHDISDIKGNINTLDSLEQFTNVQIIKKYEKIENIFLLAFNKNQGELLTDMIENYDINPIDTNILISHFGVNEGMLSTGMSIKTGIKAKHLFGLFNKIILGHYHKPQEILSEDKTRELIYVGSPIQLNWGEKNEDKRFMVINTESLEIEYIETETQKYIEVEINSIEDLKIFEEKWDLTDINNQYRIKTTLNRKEVLEENSSLKELNIPIIEAKPELIDNNGDKIKDEVRLSNNMSRSELFKEYLKIVNIDEKYHDQYLKVLDKHLVTIE
jgi:DNA repair exonuclease SbcCD nuclease subunit